MHFENKTCFVVVLIAIITLTAGCSSLPFPGSTTTNAPDKIDIGFSSTPASSVQIKYSFDRFLSVLSAAQLSGEENTRTNSSVNETRTRHFLYIRGAQMDESGIAESWVAVVREGNITSMLFYDKFGERITGTSAKDNLPAIPMDRILTPAQLFDQNSNLIFNRPHDTDPGPMALELSDSIYTLTIPIRDTPRILKFDALTGALIESNE